MSNHISLDEAMYVMRNKYINAKTSTTKNVDSLFSKIKKYEQGFTGEQGKLLVSFYEEEYNVPAFTRPLEKKHKQGAGFVIRLHFLMQGKEYGKHCNYFSISTIPWWDAVLEEFRSWLVGENYSSATVETRVKHVRAFLRHVDDRGVESIESLGTTDFSSFVAGMDPRGYRYSSRTSMLSSLRVFIESPVCKDKIRIAPMNLISGIRNTKHDVLPSVFSPDEMVKLISTVDRYTRSGKLQYAVMLLASVYGIRNIDITNLRLENIKWDENRISFIQHKTLRPVELSLMDEVRYALLDYISNCRPESKLTNIFITGRAPHTPYVTLSRCIMRAFKEAGIDTRGRHHGLHSLRHSLATMLHEKETPVNQIADILGHSTSQSTMTYIWSDIEHLRKVAGEVPLC